MEPLQVDEKPGEKPKAETIIGSEPPDVTVGVIDKTMPYSPALAPRRRRRFRPSFVIATAASVIALVALATSAWIYTDMRREVLRVSTEIAQLRLSLDLYVQRAAAAAASAAPAEAIEGANTVSLSALENRLAILEQNWRGSGVSGGTAPSAVPAVSGPVASGESDGDCLPSGMRLLVAAGDAYPVCGTDATIEVMNVSNGYISLTDGTTVPSGGTVPLNGTACMIAVTSGGDEAETGFAEIRVSC